MLINELRETIKQYDEESLRYIVCEMYKLIPKKLKEEKGFDELISDLENYKKLGKSNKKEVKVNLPELKQDIERFTFLALNSHYYAPNKIVHKNERSKWRFKVKAFVKDLERIQVTSENAPELARLFEMMFYVLSEACGTYLFPSDDPFGAIGISQTDFLDKVFIRKYAYGLNGETIKSGIQLIINCVFSRDTHRSELLYIFIEHMKTMDAKEIAIEQCKLIKEELVTLQQKNKKRSSLDYKQTRRLNCLTELVFRLNIEQKEYEDAISYLKKNYIEKNEEVELYILLGLLYDYDLKELWVKEYNLAVKKGVKPRDYLNKVYDYSVEHGSLPDRFYL